MFSRAVLFLISLIGLAYYSLSISLKIGDLYFSFQVWQLGIAFFALCSVYLAMKRILKRIFRAFQWYRDYLESFTPSRAIVQVIDYKLDLNKEGAISQDNMSLEKRVYVELINFLTGKHASRKTLGSQMHGDILCNIDEIEIAMSDGSYAVAMRFLKGLMKQYGCIPWVYANLRECYLKTKNLSDLEELNNLAAKSGIANIDLNEVKLIRLREDFTKTKDMSKRMVIAERIYKICPADSSNLYEYLLCLQSFAQFAAGIELIKNTTESSPEFISLACEFFELEDATTAINYAYRMKTSALKYVLLFNSALRKGDSDMIEHAIVKLYNFDPILSRILELKWHQESDNPAKLNKLLTAISKTYLLDAQRRGN